MAKQTLNIGTVANDGTGDTIRDASDKTNDNFTELYDLVQDAGGLASSAASGSAVQLASTSFTPVTITNANQGSQSIVNHSLILLNDTTAISLNVPDGVLAGEMKIFVNNNTATATLNAVSSNFNLPDQGTSVGVLARGALILVWSGSKWHMVGTDTANSRIS